MTGVTSRKPSSTLPKIGIFPACTDYSMNIVDLALAAEERGLTGIFLNEHTHIPVDHATSKFPSGGPVPERYARFWDPYVSLAFVAARTGLEVGTSISLVAEHDPIALAKAVATLDTLSGGRLVFGVGWGWGREEVLNHGHPPERRADVLEETVRLMKALWTQEVASFEGEFFKMTPSMSWPKCHQKPHVPVYLGVPGVERNFERLARYAEGWFPLGRVLSNKGQFGRADDFPGQLDALARAMETAGRDPQSMRIRVIEHMDSVNDLPRLRELGATYGVEGIHISMRDDGPDKALRELDEIAAALA